MITLDDYKVIGLAGVARVGKTTTADIFEKTFGVYPIAFADPIKSMIREMDPSIPWYKYEENKEEIIPELGVSLRFLYQTLGTEWGRNLVRPQIWTEVLQRTVERNSDLFLVTDVRYVNEADWVRDQGGLIIHVHKESPAEVRAHSSEAGVDIVVGDQHIYNNGTIQDLEEFIRGNFRRKNPG